MRHAKTTYAYLEVEISLSRRSQTMVGAGLPVARQMKLTTPSVATLASLGPSVMRGAPVVGKGEKMGMRKTWFGDGVKPEVMFWVLMIEHDCIFCYVKSIEGL